MVKIKTGSIERKVKSFIPSVIKNLITKLFVNSLCGFIIKKFRFKFNLHKGIFDYTQVNILEAANIFFDIWESAEIRFAKRFANSQTIVELEILYPRLVTGGVLIIDDYGYWEGARKATDEFFKKKWLHYVDHSCRYIIKT